LPYAPPKHRPSGWRQAPPEKSTDPFYGSTSWKYLREYVRQRERGICSRCGAPNSRYVDHISPRALGGLDDPSNLRLFCSKCDNRRHSEKGRFRRD
jgi:5-methylcytosine-specific restriction protein A